MISATTHTPLNTTAAIEPMVRQISPEDEPHRAFLMHLSDKEFMTFEIAKEIQIGIFDVTATNLYIKWLGNPK